MSPTASPTSCQTTCSQCEAGCDFWSGHAGACLCTEHRPNVGNINITDRFSMPDSQAKTSGKRVVNPGVIAAESSKEFADLAKHIKGFMEEEDQRSKRNLAEKLRLDAVITP